MAAERGRDLIELYGSYPVAKTFAVTDNVPDLAETEMPTYSAAFDADPTTKRHAACDECRKRKLKCSGEPSGCSRCLKQTLTCHYSLQSKMGRPRKRQKVEGGLEDDAPPAETQEQQPLLGGQPGVEPRKDRRCQKAIARTEFENVCTAPISQSIRRSAAASNLTNSTSQGSNNTSPRTPPDEAILPNGSYPTDVSLWPDFSDMTMLPMLVQDSHEQDKALSSFNTSAAPMGAYLAAHDHSLAPNQAHLSQLPAVPDCPCLPNLYLTLSTLSTLSAFPVSSGTVDTLLNSHRTGRSVIYCAVCPQKFQSGSQNVMLSSMLITVLADHWLRVKKSSVAELRKGFSDGDNDGDTDVTMTSREDLEWRTFGYRLIRACVFGDAAAPIPPGSNRPVVPASPYTLSDMCSALERRQKQWHAVEPWTGEFAQKLSDDVSGGNAIGMTLEELKECEEQSLASGDDGMLCLRIVKHARMIMRSLDGPPPRLGD
ncbi:hypothetical protein PV08_05229 [Exophiala spinifera]|uniref:Zn(2)-C6 fungal-type domain-containing protein n=1 Tax=Exophiala spinifera TaxID=91928 RepID=A0A0D2BV95_9EURO|nr:uncharacterized protein PV08_05229 [Exophiala spinifera]KIW15184.1 hypothetical protein PV08_05229 [Exophiala spinifera]